MGRNASALRRKDRSSRRPLSLPNSHRQLAHLAAYLRQADRVIRQTVRRAFLQEHSCAVRPPTDRHPRHHLHDGTDDLGSTRIRLLSSVNRPKGDGRRCVRPPGAGPIRRSGGMSDAVTALRLHPGLNEHAVRAVLDQPGLRGVVLEAYGAGNGPTDAWFLDPLRAAVTWGVTVVVTTQCRAGSVIGGLYATGSALLATGAIPGGDMTFEAAVTKLMVLVDRHTPDDVCELMQHDLAGELTVQPDSGFARPVLPAHRCRPRMSDRREDHPTTCSLTPDETRPLSRATITSRLPNGRCRRPQPLHIPGWEATGPDQLAQRRR